MKNNLPFSVTVVILGTAAAVVFLAPEVINRNAVQISVTARVRK